MNRITLISAAGALDTFAGDPEWFPHPVRLIGLAISQGEKKMRLWLRNSRGEIVGGTALSVAVISGSYWFTWIAIRYAKRYSPLAGNAVELLLTWTCLASRNLYDEASTVVRALEDGDLVHARLRLARIVGRDTASLDSSEISRAVIETIAESACDGVIAPMFYITLGGAPLAMAYKATNTLDSMIGHADQRYFYFGKAAARLDDLANLIPSRLTALAIVASAFAFQSSSGTSALRTFLQDGNKHKSPNAGQPESALSGALNVRLGGRNTYNGEPSEGPLIGHEFLPPDPIHARRALKFIGAITLLGVAAGMFWHACTTSRSRSSS